MSKTRRPVATVPPVNHAMGARQRDFGFADFAAFAATASPEGPGGHDTRLQLDVDTVVILQDVRPDILDALRAGHWLWGRQAGRDPWPGRVGKGGSGLSARAARGWLKSAKAGEIQPPGGWEAPRRSPTVTL